MKRDIQKAVEEIKSAEMEEFLYQDPITFECDDDKSSGHKCTTDGKCPRTKCTRVKKCVRFEKKGFCKKKKKFDYFWYKKRNC
ncbi:hypothetical protein AALF16_01770 [Bacillus cereus]